MRNTMHDLQTHITRTIVTRGKRFIDQGQFRHAPCKIKDYEFRKINPARRAHDFHHALLLCRITVAQGARVSTVQVFLRSVPVREGFVTPVTHASLRGAHVGVTKTNRSRI